jgi:hypothetical protein
MRHHPVVSDWMTIVAYCEWQTARATAGTRDTLRDWKAKNFNTVFRKQAVLRKSPRRGTITGKPAPETVGETEK